MGSASHLFQYGKLRQKTIFLVYEMNNLKDMKEDLKGVWVKVPSLKKAFGVFLKWGLHLILFSMSNCVLVPTFMLVS